MATPGGTRWTVESNRARAGAQQPVYAHFAAAVERHPLEELTNAQVSDWCRDGVPGVLSHLNGSHEAIDAFKAIAEGLHLGGCVAALQNYESNNP